MYKVSVMYPTTEGADFDFDYYCNKHIPMVEERMRPFGLLRTAVEKGLPTADGQAPPYVCVGHLYFETADGYDKSIQAHADELRGDLKNYTTIRPQRLLGEVLMGE